MIYDDAQREQLAKQDNEAVLNTFYRMPVVSPNINFYGDHITVNTPTYVDGINLYKIDEVILYIIGVFKFAPFWLVNQWYRLYGKNGNISIENMVKVGIVWLEASALGVMIRPTQWLFKQLDIEEQYRYWLDIPFNLMNHTCAEEQIMFDIMMGNEASELWQQVKKIPNLLPCHHPFKITPQEDYGTIILQESYFHDNLELNKEEKEAPKTEGKKERNTKAKRERDFAMSVLAKQDDIIKGIRAGSKYTMEFQDQSLLTLIPKDFGIDPASKTQRPDSAILVPRDSGRPQSIAIELELTKKGAVKNESRYDKIMENYKNNLIYGTLIYLCATSAIREAVMQAYHNVGLGSCRLLCLNYTSPAQALQDMADAELAKQEAIEKMSKSTTKGGNLDG